MAGQGFKPPPLNLSLKSFNKSTLRKTETTITNPDGTKVVEGFDEEGKPYRRPSESDIVSHGFVIDTAEDLQVAEVLPGLIMGSQDVAHSLETLERFNVTHILNVACGVSNIFSDRIKYQTQEFRDLPDFPIFYGFEKAIAFINEARDSSGCVLVHCNAGISRSAAVVMAYLIKMEGMTLNKAFSYLRSKRPLTCPNPGFMIQLESYYESIHGESQH